VGGVWAESRGNRVDWESSNCSGRQESSERDSVLGEDIRNWERLLCSARCHWRSGIAWVSRKGRRKERRRCELLYVLGDQQPDWREMDWIATDNSFASQDSSENEEIFQWWSGEGNKLFSWFWWSREALCILIIILAQSSIGEDDEQLGDCT